MATLPRVKGPGIRILAVILIFLVNGQVFADDPPTITLQPRNQQVKAGGIAVFYCAARGDPTPVIQWKKNSKLVSDTQLRYQVKNFQEGSALLRIEPVRAVRDDATYECVAENGVGDAVSAEATLTVFEANKIPPGFPHIMQSPATSKVVEIGLSTVLTCGATGNPPPVISWVHNMLPIDTSNTSRYSLSDEIPGTLQIQKSEEKDQGKYECVAENFFGTEYSKSAVLYVKVRRVLPQFSVLPPSKQEVMLGADLNLMCVAVGSPMPYVMWRKGATQEITPADKLPIGINRLELTNIQESANYTCIAESALGVIQTVTEVKVQQPETYPRNVQARPLSSTTMVIQWDEPGTFKGQVTGYKVYYTIDPQLAMAQWQSQMVDNNQLTTISDLIPHTIYTIRVQVFTSVGPSSLSPPINVKTQKGVPSQPTNLRTSDVGETTVTLQWSEPTHSGENILSYELYWNDTNANEKHHRRIPISEEYKLTGLFPNSLYYVWLAARSQRGEGATTPQISIRTKKYVPGNPEDVKVTPINSTTIKINWKSPLGKDLNRVIHGYHVLVQETKKEGSLRNEPMKFDVRKDALLELKVGDLQPDTKYTVQVAPLIRGDPSWPVSVKTPEGVPNRPNLNLNVIEREPTVTVELEWSQPTQTYGELQGYQIRFGAKGQTLKEVMQKGVQTTSFRITELESGVEYEFRVAGKNHIGIGHEAIKYMHTPEGSPTEPSTNISYHFQTPDVVCIAWDSLSREHKNGQLTKYEIQFHKESDNSNIIDRNLTTTKTVFTNLEENTEYVFHIKAYISQGSGLFSEKITIQTEPDIIRAPMSVRAVATSDSTVEVWWEPVPSREKVIGYQIFYTMIAVEDLGEWQQQSVGLTESANLINLEKFAQYTIAVTARLKNNSLGRLSEKVTVKIKPEDVPLHLRAYDVTTHSMTLSWSPPIHRNLINYKISFDAIKTFVDAQGITQMATFDKVEILLKQNITSHTINQLSPFTTYNVNVSAVPIDHSYRPPTKIIVTTQMAAPKPMVKPDFYEIVNDDEIQVILPQASEEYGPISHYYLIVVPEDIDTAQRYPDEYLTDVIIENQIKNPDDINAPYIAAKFPQRNIPYTFHLGTGNEFDGFKNRKLELGKRYRIFVRAVVDALQQDLYTSSPFSNSLSLIMPVVPSV